MGEFRFGAALAEPGEWGGKWLQIVFVSICFNQCVKHVLVKSILVSYNMFKRGAFTGDLSWMNSRCYGSMDAFFSRCQTIIKGSTLPVLLFQPGLRMLLWAQTLRVLRIKTRIPKPG